MFRKKLSWNQFVLWLDNLKVRASYGILGNQLLTASSWSGNTKYYPYIPFMAFGYSRKWKVVDGEKSLYINWQAWYPAT